MVATQMASAAVRLGRNSICASQSHMPRRTAVIPVALMAAVMADTVARRATADLMDLRTAAEDVPPATAVVALPAVAAAVPPAGAVDIPLAAVVDTPAVEEADTPAAVEAIPAADTTRRKRFAVDVSEMLSMK